MAQLSDDCFAFGGALLGVDAALALIEERVTPVVEADTVSLAAASGRILADAPEMSSRCDEQGFQIPAAKSTVRHFVIGYRDKVQQLAAKRQNVNARAQPVGGLKGRVGHVKGPCKNKYG